MTSLITAAGKICILLAISTSSVAAVVCPNTMSADMRKMCFAVQFKSRAHCLEINDKVIRAECLVKAQNF